MLENILDQKSFHQSSQNETLIGPSIFPLDNSQINQIRLHFIRARIREGGGGGRKSFIGYLTKEQQNFPRHDLFNIFLFLGSQCDGPYIPIYHYSVLSNLKNCVPKTNPSQLMSSQKLLDSSNFLDAVNSESGLYFVICPFLQMQHKFS